MVKPQTPQRYPLKTHRGWFRDAELRTAASSKPSWQAVGAELRHPWRTRLITAAITALAFVRAYRLFVVRLLNPHGSAVYLVQRDPRGRCRISSPAWTNNVAKIPSIWSSNSSHAMTPAQSRYRRTGFQ